MAWGFQSGRGSPVGPVHKPAVQLMQEAAVVLAQGGGFQIYYQPTRAGYLDDRHVGVMEKVARFCRERQELCHKSETVPETGVLFSRHSLYRAAPRLFGGWGAQVDQAGGTVDALVENHMSVDVIPDWRLGELAAKYALIVVPDWSDIGAEARDALLVYARGGGRLLLIGAETAAAFRDVLQVRFLGEPRDQPAWIPGVEVFANMRGRWQDVELAGAHELETRFPTYDATRDGRPAATLAAVGSGMVAAIYGPAGTVFAKTHAPETRRLIGRVARRLHEPSIALEAPPVVEVVRRRKGGRQMVHLLNYSGMQVASDYGAVDYVPPAGPMKISIRMERRPRRVTLEPGGRELRGTWSNGAWSAPIDRLDIHAILAWEA
jgi:hypothetical protein